MFNMIFGNNTIPIIITQTIITYIIVKYINGKNKNNVETMFEEKIKKIMGKTEEIENKNKNTLENMSGTLLNVSKEIDAIKRPTVSCPDNNNLILSTNSYGMIGAIEFPRGMIISWIPPQYIDNEDETQDRLRPPAPVGWAYCDGTNGTPDLRCSSLIGVGFEDEKITREIDPREHERHMFDTREAKIRTNVNKINIRANWSPNFMIGWNYLGGCSGGERISKLQHTNSAQKLLNAITDIEKREKDDPYMTPIKSTAWNYYPNAHLSNNCNFRLNHGGARAVYYLMKL